jgi:hypothetical protein
MSSLPGEGLPPLHCIPFIVEDNFNTYDLVPALWPSPNQFHHNTLAGDPLLDAYIASLGLRNDPVCIVLEQHPGRDCCGRGCLNQRDVLVMCAVPFFNR